MTYETPEILDIDLGFKSEELGLAQESRFLTKFLVLQLKNKVVLRVDKLEYWWVFKALFVYFQIPNFLVEKNVFGGILGDFLVID